MPTNRISPKGYRRLEDWSLKRFLGHHYQAFEGAMLELNLRRLLVINVLLMVTETVLLILPEPGMKYHFILIWFLLGNAIILVLQWLSLSAETIQESVWRHGLTVLDLCLKFALTIALSLASQGAFDFVHMTIAAMYIMVTVVYLRNAFIGVILLGVPLIYALLLPGYQSDANQQFILVSNLVIFALGAWIVGFLINRDRATTFKAQQELEELLKRDLMTKLYNHDTILDLVTREVDAARADAQPLSMLLLDLDDFKAINDQHGHLKGDEVLLSVVDVLRKSTRSTDLIGRYGGEEFIVLFTRTDLSVAMKISERIRVAIEAVNISGVTVTVSGGLTQLADESVDVFFKTADDKLYQAKRSGKNQIITT